MKTSNNGFKTACNCYTFDSVTDSHDFSAFLSALGLNHSVERCYRLEGDTSTEKVYGGKRASEYYFVRPISGVQFSKLLKAYKTSNYTLFEECLKSLSLTYDIGRKWGDDAFALTWHKDVKRGGYYFLFSDDEDTQASYYVSGK